jgi:hypothetical protein
MTPSGVPPITIAIKMRRIAALSMPTALATGLFRLSMSQEKPARRILDVAHPHTARET